MKTDSDLLKQNPFYKLQATARCSDAELLEKSEELFLLTGTDTKDAVNTLLQPIGRIRAELAFLPGMTEDEIQQLTILLEASEHADTEYTDTAKNTDAAYADTEHTNTAHMDTEHTDTVHMDTEHTDTAKIPSEVPSDLPSFEDTDPLARVNAVCALLEGWPAADAESACALCLSVVGCWSDVRPDDVREILLKERQIAGKSMTETPEEIRLRLRKHQEALLRRISARTAAFPQEQKQLLLQKLADAFADKKGPYYLSSVLSSLVRTILFPGQKVIIEELCTRINSLMAEYRSNTLQDKRNELLQELLAALEDWFQASLPERTILQAEGICPEYVKDLSTAAISLSADMFNEWKEYQNSSLLAEKMLKVFPDVSEGVRQVMEKNAGVLKIQALAAKAASARKKSK